MTAFVHRIVLALVLLAGAARAAEPRPIRVLFLGHESTLHNSATYLPLLMQAMGRETIYFGHFDLPPNAEVTTPTHRNHEPIQV